MSTLLPINYTENYADAPDNVDPSSSFVVDDEKLLTQIRSEYEIAKAYITPKWEQWKRNLKLYNNQRRNPEDIGDPLLFTVFQTIFASLYDDTMSVSFKGREEGDEEATKNLNDLAIYDYDEMEKALIDYDWDWDTLFFGRGLLLFNEFYRNESQNKAVPMPEVIDPLVFLRDPDAVSFNGDGRGRGSARYFGLPRFLAKSDMTIDAGYERVGEVQCSDDLTDEANQASQARADANNTTRPNHVNSADLGDNQLFEVLQWFTYFNGKKVICTVANDRTLLIKYEEIDASKPWPCVDRPLWPTAHTWDGTSIPDVTEDKQRARAITQNYSLKILKSQLQPVYIYDKTRIHDPNMLNHDFNKAVGVDGNPANVALPLAKDNPNMGMVEFIMTSLDNAAQRASATPEVQQGVVSQDSRTATELNLITQKAATRYSLTAKLFSISERKFWEQWYYLYKEHFTQGIDKKVVRIENAFGNAWRPLTRENIVAHVDPDVRVVSKAAESQERQMERQLFIQYLQLLAGDPEANLRYGIKHAAGLFGLDQGQVDRLLPPTPDEMQAESENERLNKDESVQVLATDNHTVHLDIHAKAKQTPKSEAHIHMHKVARWLQSTRPDLFPNKDQQPGSQPGQTPTQLPSQPSQPSPQANVPGIPAQPAAPQVASSPGPTNG